MNEDNQYLPIRWYIARIKYLEGELAKLPNVQFGKHGDRQVVRLLGDNIRKEFVLNSKNAQQYLTIASKAEHLKTDIAALKKELYKIYNIEYKSIESMYEVIPNSTSWLTAEKWNELKSDCSIPNDNEYYYNGINYRSRIEMLFAEAATELGLSFKSDAKIYLSNGPINPDFSFVFPEFNRTIFFEVLGMLDNLQYVNRNIEKMKYYSIANILPGRDLFILGASKNYVPNSRTMKDNLILIVNTLCNTYVSKNSL